MKDTVRKFNRFELKFVLPFDLAESIKKQIQPYVLPDPHGDGGKYTIASLYYDTEDYRFYWEKTEGLKFRKKLRIRWYQTLKPLSDEDLVFLEIKQRYDRVVQKKRVPLKFKEAIKFCEENIFPEHDPQDKIVLNEMYTLLNLHRLRPALVTIYDRQAFVGYDYEFGLRITFDSIVGYRSNHLDLGDKSHEGYIIPPNFVIMEIKVNEKLPIWIVNLVSRNNLRMTRVSKYCRGLEQASKIPEYVYIN